MSKGQCQPRNQPLKRALGRCKARDHIEIIDVEDKDAGYNDDDDDDDVKIIDAEASHHGMKRNSPPSDVINIDDDDEDDDDTFRYGNINSPSSEESKSGKSPMTTRPVEHRKNNCDVGPSRNRFGLGSSSESCSFGSESSSESESPSESVSSDSSRSDCEIMEDLSGNIREQWERAALKKKMSHKAQVYPEYEASFDDEIYTENVFGDPFKGVHVQSSSNSNNECKNNFCSVPSTSYFDSHFWNFDTDNTANNDIHTTSDFVYYNPSMETVPSEMNRNDVPKDTYSEIIHDFPDPIVVAKDTDSTIVHEDIEPEIARKDTETSVEDPSVDYVDKGCHSQKTAEVEEKGEEYMEEQDMSNHQFSKSTLFTPPSTEEWIDNYYSVPENGMQVQDGLVLNREKYKETDEYRQATEEEWVARQRELQIQAEEAQRLKRKKKAETLRLIDVERRQKQRIEEVRELQKKDEETINLKEHIRAGVRRELELLEMRYRDMASVLRALGVPVKGGLLPTSREVNAAYKQALLKFHPDRASRSDIHQQVKSEETFKLISRLKEKLMF